LGDFFFLLELTIRDFYVEVFSVKFGEIMSIGRYKRIKLSCFSAFRKGVYEVSPLLIQGLSGHVEQMSILEFVPIMEAFGNLVEYAPDEFLRSFAPHKEEDFDENIRPLAERTFLRRRFLGFPDGELERGKDLLVKAQIELEPETSVWYTYEDVLKRYYDFVAHLAECAGGSKLPLKKETSSPRARGHLRLINCND